MSYNFYLYFFTMMGRLENQHITIIFRDKLPRLQKSRFYSFFCFAFLDIIANIYQLS